jgi:hypothetical protein
MLLALGSTAPVRARVVRRNVLGGKIFGYAKSDKLAHLISSI